MSTVDSLFTSSWLPNCSYYLSRNIY